MEAISLLGSTARVQTPFIKVTFGDLDSGYTFGVYQKTTAQKQDYQGFYSAAHINYPNYIKSLSITKINGKVNTYTLEINYPIRPGEDPNFFEKVFSSISQTRKIIFSYGDMSLPTYIYKDEEALLVDNKVSFDMKSAVIKYIVTAVSSAQLLNSGNFTFSNPVNERKQPSAEIYNLLYNRDECGLKDIFYGMNNEQLVREKGLIPTNDELVSLDTKYSSPLEYLQYLVNSMKNAAGKVYTLNFVDDVTGEFGGPYFKVTPVESDSQQQPAYEIYIGYPTANIVTDFQIEQNENWSIYYEFQKSLNNKDYVIRINANGEDEIEFAPIFSSNNVEHRTKAIDETWWEKVTQYPINASITLRGLLRPAVLMTHVRLNVEFHGWKHISSGLYIVTKQQDRISEDGFTTVLNLTRIAGDNDELNIKFVQEE